MTLQSRTIQSCKKRRLVRVKVRRGRREEEEEEEEMGYEEEEKEERGGGFQDKAGCKPPTHRGGNL